MNLGELLFIQCSTFLVANILICFPSSFDHQKCIALNRYGKDKLQKGIFMWGPQNFAFFLFSSSTSVLHPPAPPIASRHSLRPS
jgi:hypothetical protein